MRFFYLLLVLTCLSLPTYVFGQCPPPGFPDAGNNCGSPILCENLDGYCNEINNNNQSRPFPCCSGWTLNNDEWFGFFAGTTTITIEIVPSNCSSGGQQGLQGGIYDNCPPSNPTPGTGSPWCDANMMDVQCACTEDPFILSSTNFVVGEVYWIVLDGCAGNVCDYTVNVLEGSTVGFAPADPGPITGPDLVCQGGSGDYSIGDINGATNYNWTLVPSNAGSITGNGTTDVSVNWSAGFNGTAQICVTSSNLCFSNPTQSCFDVTVAPLPTASISGTYVICANSGGSVDIPITLTGQPDWRLVYSIGGVQQPPVIVSSSPYVITVSDPGAVSLVSVATVGISPACVGTVSGSATVTSVTLNPTATTVSANCGTSTGSVDLSISGGNAPYTYSWGGGETTQDLSMVPPGTYNVTVTDNNGCTGVLSATVNDNITNPSLTAAIVNNTTCIGGNGSINLSVTPAGSYTYLWSPGGETTEDISNLAPGDYTVTVSQGLTCSAVSTFTVGDVPNTPTVTLTPTASTCDLMNGSINASVSGGVPPYTFSWSGGETTQNLTDIVAGNYSLTVTGANGCTSSASANVSNNNPPITVTATVVANTTCNGGNGSINVTAAPAGNYTFMWSPGGETTEDITGLLPGDYTVTVSAGGSCTAVSTFNVPDNPNLPVPTAVATQTSCDFSNGSVNGSVSGGTPPYTFAWSNGATTEDIANVPTGNYVLTVTDALGCTGTVSVDVTNNNPVINITATVVSNTTCNGGNGSIDVSITPANNYTYSWSPGGATTQDIAGLTPGNYTITVSAGGSCTAEATFNVPDDPNLPTPTAIPTASSCDLPNGSINGGATGGVPPYMFMWSNGATTEDISNVLPGSYVLTVTGANGCTNTINVDIPNVNPPINVTATAQPNTVCNASPNGSIDVTVNPPGNYTYNWSNGATTQDLTGVGPGSYTLTVSAGGSCTQVVAFDVPANPNEPNVMANIVNTSCDFPNGSINITVTGGPTPYTYSWSNGATTQNLSNLLAGDYSITVTSPNGCTGVANLNVANINPPIDLDANILPNTSCNASSTGSIDLTVSPFGNYTYIWSNGATTQDISNLPTGAYTVTVSAGGTCTQVGNFFVPNEPNNPDLSYNLNNANCGLPNGMIDVMVFNGVPPYTYAWSSGQSTQDLNNVPSGNYILTITGANGCTVVESIDVPNDDIPVFIDANVIGKTSCIVNNGSIALTVTPSTSGVSWSNGSSLLTLSNLAPGTYTVTVSAGGNCTATETYTIDDNTETPILTADIIPALCGFANGEVDLSVDFGIPPYTYNWQHIPGNSNLEDIFGLAAGNYVVTVTTSVGCTEVLFAPVDNEVLQMDITGIPFDDFSCTSNNGFIDIDVNPMLNYTYDWQHIPGPSNQQDLINLGAGTYTVTITYGSCSQSVTYDVIDATEPPSVSISPSAATCGQSNGAISLSVSGATPPYSFNWQHIPGNNNPQNLNNLPPGTYFVTVTDFFDCTATAQATVVNNTIAVNIMGVPTPNTSCAAPNGSLDVSVTPANANYTYTWSNMANTQDLTNLAPGTYSVTVSAGVGCTAAATFQVGNNTINPLLEADVVAAICSQSNGEIDLTISNGTAPYLYVWSNMANTEDLQNIFPGNYSVTVTDANGCSSDTTLNVANNASTFSLAATTVPYSDCATVNGAINLTVTPAGPYTFLWSTGETTEDLSGVPGGTYTVEVTEQGTCIASATYFVLDTRSYPTLNQSIIPELCNLLDGGIDLSVTGGLAPYTYTWDSGETTQDLINIGGGPHEVTVTGANNCTATASLNIPENDLDFVLSGVPTANSSCVVLNGSVDLDISPAVPNGGPGYTYTWSNGQMTQDISGVSSGTYIVTVSAGGTCTNTISFNVADVAGAPGVSENITQALCGQSNGAINITIIGGTAPFTYNWSTGSTNEDVTGLASGNYAVTVIGANGCQVVDNFVVPENTITPTLSGIPQPNTACVGPNGTINLSIAPASLMYNILWSTGATTQNISNLTAGTYTVVVNGGGACTNSATIVVDNNTQGVVATGTDVDILCFGNNTGAIDLTLSGGTQPFVFVWSPTLGGVEDPSGLVAGTYSVVVTDAVGCTATASFDITQPSAAVQVNCSALSTVTQPGAADGTAQVQIAGGVAPYTILWSPGGTQSGLPAGPFPLNNLGVGNYSVTVTDANGCTAICGFAIQLTPCVTAIGTMGTGALSLCGAGCLTANYDGLGQMLDPNDVLQFILHEGNGSTIVNEKARSTQPTFCFNPANMTYGTTYYVSAVAGNNDGSGNVVLAHYCTVVATGTPIAFYQKPVATAALPARITCATLEVPVEGSSSIPNSDFQWTTQNGVILGNSNQATINTNQAGDFTLIVNANGCLDTTMATVLDIRNDPSALITASPNDILDCVIDEIVLAGEIKGTGNSNSIWYDQNGVTYPGGTVLQINIPGTYWFAIVDTVTFCTDTTSIVIGENQIYPPLFIDPPAILTCTVGSVVLSGGSPYPGIDFAWVVINGQDTTIVGSGNNTTVVQAGSYWLFGVDPANGCNNSQEVVVISDQSYPTADAGAPFNIDCFGETASLTGTATGGTGSYSYIWTTTGGQIVSGMNTLNPTINEPGTYTLSVLDIGNSCSATDVVLISPNEPVAIPIVNNPACVGQRGTILIDTVLGAKPPLQYTLTGGTYIQSGSLFANLEPGDYSIFIEDANGCATSVNATIVPPPVFEITVESQVLLQLGESYQIDATVNVPDNEIASIQWTPPTWLSCDTCLSTRIDTPLTSQNYRIVVVTTAGCRDDALLALRVNRQVDVYIPNVFTPNDDGDNDWFTVFADMRGVKQVKLFQIFSRWGEEVFVRENFQPNEPTLGWDGRFRGADMNPAVFVYYAIVEYIDGQEVLFKGDVTIVR